MSVSVLSIVMSKKQSLFSSKRPILNLTLFQNKLNSWKLQFISCFFANRSASFTYLILNFSHPDLINGSTIWSSRPEVFFGKGALKIYTKFAGEHPQWSVISIELQSTSSGEHFWTCASEQFTGRLLQNNLLIKFRYSNIW